MTNPATLKRLWDNDPSVAQSSQKLPWPERSNKDPRVGVDIRMIAGNHISLARWNERNQRFELVEDEHGRDAKTETKQ